MEQNYPAENNFVKFENKYMLPSIPGIYFVMQDDEVLYVGQARNIKKRWESHHKTIELQHFENITIHWIESDGRSLFEQEKEYIYFFHPPLNRNVTKFFETRIHPDISEYIPESGWIMFCCLIQISVLPILAMVALRDEETMRKLLNYSMILGILAFAFLAGVQFAWKEAIKRVKENKDEA